MHSAKFLSFERNYEKLVIDRNFSVCFNYIDIFISEPRLFRASQKILIATASVTYLKKILVFKNTRTRHNTKQELTFSLSCSFNSLINFSSHLRKLLVSSLNFIPSSKFTNLLADICVDRVYI